MIRTQVYLQDQQYHLAKLYTQEEGGAFSQAIREGLDMWLAAKAKQKTKKRRKAFEGYIGSIKMGYNANAARDHNDIYDGKLSQELEE